MEKNYFDILIIGSGPAGMTAAIYALRSGMKVGIIEKGMIGGQAVLTYEIRNFPGFESISGMDLALKIQAQAENLGAEFIFDNIKEIDLANKKVFTDYGEYFSTSIILCMGASARKLDIENEDKLIGKGIAYCAICDGAFFRNEDVVLVGGGNSAVEDAIYMSEVAKSITIVNNLNKFTCQETLLFELNEIIEKRKNIRVFHNCVISEINGNQNLESVKITNLNTNEFQKIDCRGMFVAIGRKPDVENVIGQIKINNFNYIISDKDMHTNVEGVFVAGDIREKKLRQIITACADGAIAGTEASIFVKKNNKN